MKKKKIEKKERKKNYYKLNTFRLIKVTFHLKYNWKLVKYMNLTKYMYSTNDNLAPNHQDHHHHQELCQ